MMNITMMLQPQHRSSADDTGCGGKHQIKNTSDETMKLATVFVPGFSMEDNIKRCQQAAAQR